MEEYCVVLSAVPVGPWPETLRVRLERSWRWRGVAGVVKDAGALVVCPRVFLPVAAGLRSRRSCARFPVTGRENRR